jgi:hypothetical protein
VVKHRASPFVGTDLETLLRASGIDTLVLAGVHTSGVVLSTVRHAGDLDVGWWSSAIAAPTQMQRCMRCCRDYKWMLVAQSGDAGNDLD